MARGRHAAFAHRTLGLDKAATTQTRYEDVADHQDLYLEEEISVPDFFRTHRPTVQGLRDYFQDLFPFWNWIFHYNITWLVGDMIAGVTVGFIVVPQAMSYALLAQLPPEYGLYTSFVGTLVYWLFATSKDVTIGSVAVASSVVGNAVSRIQTANPDISADHIARALALACGAVLLVVGLIRAGFIVEAISLTVIASFMTGAAISIGVGQIPALLGLQGVNSREATHLVIINTLKALPTARLDAALGMSTLFTLYLWRWFCGFMAEHQPKHKKAWFFASTVRQSCTVILFILLSWLVNRNRARVSASEAAFDILGTVPSGFRHTGLPFVDSRLLRAIAPDIPTTTLVLVIEHISISKFLSRVNNYAINPSQEFTAIGVANLLGPFLGALPQTGSFSRTAIQAKAGVRTPLAGLFTAAIVLLALYALTSVFFYVPSAVLSAIIIHAVGDLITPPRELWRIWRASPVEIVVYFVGVFFSIFTSLEDGIYVTVCLGAAILLFRIAKDEGRFLGRLHVSEVSRDAVPHSRSKVPSTDGHAAENKLREVFVPLDHSDLSNPRAAVTSPYPGVFVYRFGESFNYLNCAHHLDILATNILRQTRMTELEHHAKVGDRPWNDPGPRRGHHASPDEARRPLLHAVVLDFSSVSFLDATSSQALQDLRGQFDRHAAPRTVNWHFAGVVNPWTRRALVASGFGVDTADTLEDVRTGRTGPLVSIVETDGVERRGVEPGSNGRSDGAARDTSGSETEEPGVSSAGRGSVIGDAVVPLYGVNRPFFHVDVATAVRSALQGLQRKGE